MSQMALLPLSTSPDRRALGQVFTPPVLAEFILDQAGFNGGLELLDRAILEPACGDGVFLVAAARRLADVVASEKRSRSSKSFAERLAVVLSRNLWGVDVDERAANAARAAARRFFYERTGRPAPGGFLSQNIVVADFLLGDGCLRLPPIAEGRLAFIVGNPPYVPTTELSSSHKRSLRERFKTASGRIDLYGLFIERSVGLLRRGGVLSFIVPDKFLQSHTARPLRSLLVDAGSVTSIARFDSHKVFADAATVPCVFTFERGAKSSPFRALDCEYRNGTVPAQVVVSRDEQLPASRLDLGAWRTKSEQLEEIAEAIAAEHPKLGELSERISAGLATGRDSIYVVGQDVAKTLDRALLRPAVRGRDIGTLTVDESDLSIIVPFVFTNQGPTLVDIRDYPRTHDYLEQFRSDLEHRHCVRTWEKAWFDIHDPVSDDVAKLQKVLVPDVAAAPRFVFDDGKRCPLHSAYYIVPKGLDGRYLAAILNSQPIEFLVRLRAPVVKDGFNRYRRQFLIDLPIPNSDAHTIERVVRAADRRDMKKIDEIAADLFRLSDRQMKTIQNHLSRLRYRRSARDGFRDASA